MNGSRLKVSSSFCPSWGRRLGFACTKVADRLVFSPSQTQKMISEIKGIPITDSFDADGFHLVQGDTFKLMSDWYYFAILLLRRPQ